MRATGSRAGWRRERGQPVVRCFYGRVVAGAVAAVDTGCHTEHLFEMARAATTGTA